MDSEQKFKALLLDRGCILNPPGDRSHGYRLCQQYQEFLYDVANGTENRDIDGWKFWEAEHFKAVNEVKRDFSQSPLAIEQLPELYVVFADYKDGTKFLCFRKLRPKLDYPVIHIISGKKLISYANNFNDFVGNYEMKVGY